MATGSITQTMEQTSINPHQVTLKLAWVAGDATGSISSATISSNLRKTVIGKKALFAITDPGGTTAPTDNYDIAITDGYGCDVFGGALSNRSSTAVQQKMAEDTSGNVFQSGRLITSTLSFAITGNAVTGASGSIFVVLSE